MILFFRFKKKRLIKMEYPKRINLWDITVTNTKDTSNEYAEKTKARVLATGLDPYKGYNWGGVAQLVHIALIRLGRKLPHTPEDIWIIYNKILIDPEIIKKYSNESEYYKIRIFLAAIFGSPEQLEYFLDKYSMKYNGKEYKEREYDRTLHDYYDLLIEFIMLGYYGSSTEMKTKLAIEKLNVINKQLGGMSPYKVAKEASENQKFDNEKIKEWLLDRHGINTEMLLRRGIEL